MLGGGLLLAAIIAWIVGLQAMTAMPHSFAGFVALWTVMMAAMMLPAVLPVVWLFATVAQSRTRYGFAAAPSALFIGGYLGIWIVTGVWVALLDRALGMRMNDWGPALVGGALITAGLYQFTRLKGLCLGHCRAPLHFFMEQWRDGLLGAIQMGAHHGLYCLGCCWGLMLALIALGLMNPLWMGVMALLIFVEKAMPGGTRVTLFIGAAFVLAGVGIAFGWIPLQAPMGGM
ncbi:MAG: DUF2182 domain-containing protein [Ardenticatenaceae bacterium]